MIVVSIDELLEFHERKPGDYAVAVRLDHLRELKKSHDDWKAEAERLAAVVASVSVEAVR